jgi:phasin
MIPAAWKTVSAVRGSVERLAVLRALPATPSADQRHRLDDGCDEARAGDRVLGLGAVPTMSAEFPRKRSVVPKPPGANSAKTPFCKCGNASFKPEDDGMVEPKLEVPAELRELAEKTIDQAEKAFGMFFDAAGKSMASVPTPGTEISRQALSFTEQNMKAAFEHARKLVHATDLQEALQIQSEFLKSQFTNAGEHMRQITGGVMSAAKDASKGKF